MLAHAVSGVRQSLLSLPVVETYQRVSPAAYEGTLSPVSSPTPIGGIVSPPPSPVILVERIPSQVSKMLPTRMMIVAGATHRGICAIQVLNDLATGFSNSSGRSEPLSLGGDM